jgi:WD40 repeat protein
VLSVTDLQGPPDAAPLEVRSRDLPELWDAAFHPGGQWLATANGFQVALVPLGNPVRRSLRSARSGLVFSLAFTPSSDGLVSCGQEGVRLWSMAPGARESHVVDATRKCMAAVVDPDGSDLAWCGPGYCATASLEEGATPQVGRFAGEARAMTFDPQGRRLAVGNSWADTAASQSISVLGEGQETLTLPLVEDGELSEPTEGAVNDLRFAPDGALYSAGRGGVRRWDLATRRGEWLVKAADAELDLSRDGRLLLVGTSRKPHEAMSELLLLDLEQGSRRSITTHGAALAAIALAPSGRFLVTRDVDGVVRVGAASGEEPHLLLGPPGIGDALALSADERWVASATGDQVSLWPVPDLSRPPLHLLPHAELLARLNALTNLRVVPDPASATGWKLTGAPFPGWEKAPTW